MSHPLSSGTCMMVHDGVDTLYQFEWYRRRFLKLLSHIIEIKAFLFEREIIMKKLLVCLLLVVCMFGCSSKTETVNETEPSFKIGLCNYVDDASLNQIVENIKTELKDVEQRNGIKIEIIEDNANADAVVLEQIVSNFIMEDVDLMVGIATPVAMVMQAKTEDNNIPVVFAAVSDPVGSGLVESLDKPGANITGTSDYLDTAAVFNLMFALEDVKEVGLLFDYGQDASKTAITEAKAYLDNKGVSYKEYTGTNTSEVMLAVESLIADGIKNVFTPQDNTVMIAELSIFESMAKNGVKHFTGADSFALNGALLGYGVDYANLGRETAKMVEEILVNKTNPAEFSVKTFDNGTATVNSEICAELGLDFEETTKAMEPYCTQVIEITTAESFE